MNRLPDWKSGALGKFYALEAQAAALRGEAGAKIELTNRLQRSAADSLQEISAVENHIGTAAQLPGREADRERTIARIDALKAKRSRDLATLDRERAALADTLARTSQCGALLDACGRVLFRLGLLSREEAGLS